MVSSAGTRRWPLPVIFTEPGDDGSEEVESLVQEFTGSAAHQVAFHVWQSAVSDVCAVQSSQLFAGAQSTVVRGPVVTMVRASRALRSRQRRVLHRGQSPPGGLLGSDLGDAEEAIDGPSPIDGSRILYRHQIAASP